MLFIRTFRFASRVNPALLAFVGLTVLTGCSKPDVTQTVEYQSLCHGQPLKSAEARDQAMEDGYLINSSFQCIDKKSYDAVQQRKAERAFANSAEGIAKRQVDDAEREARLAAEREQRRAQREAREAAIPAEYTLRLVDANTATQAELARLCSVGDGVAADMVGERSRGGPFKGWTDLTQRVTAFHAAQTTVFASACGLTVNGESLQGAPADPSTAQSIYGRERKRRLVNGN